MPHHHIIRLSPKLFDFDQQQQQPANITDSNNEHPINSQLTAEAQLDNENAVLAVVIRRAAAAPEAYPQQP